MSTSGNSLYVVAIDFGTTYSGYAFSTRANFLKGNEKNINEIYTVHWNAGELMSEKTPTTLLLDADQNFVSFGYDAENMYSRLPEEEKKKYFYFRRFKMMLYDKDGHLKITRNTKLKDMTDKEILAIDVFTHSIKYLRGHFLDSFEKQNLKKAISPEDGDVAWVLTVPAIWDEPAKQFMEEAAEKAGIPKAYLMICLEPEAAAIYCKCLPIEKGGDCLSAMQPGRRFIVLDAGGGTIDMAIQEVTEDGKLQEIDRAQGGDWGGIYVDAQFKEMLEEIVSKPIFEAFRMRFTGDYIDLFRFFESKKREKATSKKVRMQVPQSFLSISDGDINTLTQTKGLGEYVTWKRDKIFIEQKKYEKFFNHVIDKIVFKVEEMLISETALGTDVILMVGGFSECDLLQRRIRESFPSCKVVIPPDCGLAVLKGAVIFGHDPKMIAARVVKYTYGVGTNTTFIEGKHPESKRTVKNGKVYCKDKFDIHVRKGDTIHVDETTDETYYPIYEDQTSVNFRVFTCNHVDPEYIDDEGCKEIGSLTVPMPDTSGGTSRKVKAKFKFGGTKITVEGIDETSKTSVDIKIDFLEGSP
ncbi:heat shock 70 kDa protein 12A-like [Saccostrea echinata]|uniref:heat shock 70 kDa protein 12A-like n=1 Tax=Saccostrea echinata TaxID=191078 RepID=UPI002A8393CD|nr:heat shock 70 kDa protein 12A-like [Saccostrea echinata]